MPDNSCMAFANHQMIRSVYKNALSANFVEFSQFYFWFDVTLLIPDLINFAIDELKHITISMYFTQLVIF